MKVRTVVKTSGPPLLLLAAVFVALKLTHIGEVAAWSWWWVFSPLWAPIAAAGVVSLIVAMRSPTSGTGT